MPSTSAAAPLTRQAMRVASKSPRRRCRNQRDQPLAPLRGRSPLGPKSGLPRGAPALPFTVADVTAGGTGSAITTEIVDKPPFYYAETYHQQYLAKNPNGYCGLGGTGVTCPIGLNA